MSLRVIIAALCLLFAAPAYAANLHLVTGAAQQRQGDTVLHHCNMLLSGEIQDGDAVVFEHMLSVVARTIEKDGHLLGNPRIVTLCLDSPGGSLHEALRIADLIRMDRRWDDLTRSFIQTRLQADAECLSACAMIFLAGTLDDWEGPAYPQRSMHPTARLGIHAPSLEISAGQYDEGFVNAAYDVSIAAIGEVLRILHQGQAVDGSSYSGEGSWIRASMLAEMLRTPSRSMRIVETVTDAGQWGISVSPIARPALTKETLFSACQNRRAWSSDRRAEIYDYVGDGYAGNVEPLAITGRGVELSRVQFSIDELNGLSCWIVQTDPDRFLMTLDRTPGPGEGGPVTALELYQPDTPLAQTALTVAVAVKAGDLSTRSYWSPPALKTAADFAAIETSAIAKGQQPWGPRYGGAPPSQFDHNGSVMAWERREGALFVWYFAPRPNLIQAGVRPGSLLLYKRPEHPVLARRFSARCGDIIYPVEKTNRFTHTNVYEGTYQGRTDNCGSAEPKQDQLTFHYVAQNFKRPETSPDGTAPDTLMRLTGVNTSLSFREGPHPKARRYGELPAGLTGIRLLACRPLIFPGYWQSGSAAQRRVMLDDRWCSLHFNGATGFVSGRFLTPQ